MASSIARSLSSTANHTLKTRAYSAATMIKAQSRAVFPSRSLLQGAPLRHHSGRHPRLGAVILKASWGAEVEFADAKILETQKIAENLHKLLVDIGAAGAAGYTTSGQFIQAKVEPEGKAGFFAIASAPDANNAGVVELLIKSQGETAEALCAALEGSTVKCSAVMGKGFPVDRVPSDSFKKVFLFATGSGISPIKALIESGALNAAAREAVVLYYGARSPEFMAYKEKLGQWEEEFGVKVVPVYSQDGAGYVQDVFVKEAALSGGAEGVAAVLCGQKGMAEAVTEALTTAGVSKEHILTNF